MKNTVIALLLAAVPAAASEIAWQKSGFDAILGLAAKQKKPVAIDFYAVWCGPCKKMDKETFTDAKVKELAGKFVMAKFDAEAPDEGVALAKKYQVGSFPTLVFLAPDGKELDRFTGFRDAKGLLPYMEMTLEGKSRLDKLVADLVDRPGDAALVAEIAESYVVRVDEANALKYLKALEDMDPKNAEGRMEEAGLGRADLYRRQKDFGKAAASLEALHGSGVKLENERAVLSDLGLYYCRADDAAKSLVYYKRLIEKFPDADSYNAMAWEYSQRKMNLKEAEEAGKKAVELKPEPGIMDTLAEVYFAQGRYDEAIELAKKEVAAEPDDPYFAKQLAKYEAAKAGPAPVK